MSAARAADVARRGWPLGALALLVALAWSVPSGAQVIELESVQSQDDDASPETQAAPLAGPAALAADRGRAALSADRAGADGPGDTATLLPLRPAAPSAEATRYPRFAGEVARERFLLFLPAAPGAAQLHLAHRSGIDVLPEMSRIEIVVNGTAVGTITPENFDAFDRDTIAVPDGVLRTGQNRIDIVAHHTHRIACGPEAAFALWTEIDIAASGVPMPAETLMPGPRAFLAALAAQSVRGDPLSIRRPDPAAPLTDAVPFILRLVSAIGGAPPAIASEPYWTVAGAQPDHVRVTVLEPGEGASTPRFVRGGDGAIVLLVEHGDAFADVASLLVDVSDADMTEVRPVLQPGVATELSAFGVSTLQAHGRYDLVQVPFRLPTDWLLLASQKARLDLDYRFAPDLPAGALMLVKVNGTTVRLLPLDIDVSDGLPTLPVRFQANLLRPGNNRLDFEVMVPGDPPDVACPPIDGPLVEILPTSRLNVPPSPAMSLPSLDAVLERMPPAGIRLTQAAAAQMNPGFAPQVAAALQSRGIEAMPDATLRIGMLADLDAIGGPVMAGAARPIATALRGPFPGGADANETDVNAWADVGPLAWLTTLPDRLVTSLQRLAYGDTPDLATWLSGRSARAALLQPDPANAGEIWLIVAPGDDPSDVVRALSASRGSASGPTGQVALYEPGRGWQSWTAPDRPLSLLEPLRVADLRAVTGNYATLSPTTFTAAFLGLAVLSALVAIPILILTRRGRS